MEPIQVVLSGNLKKHKALRVSFYDVEWDCTWRKGGQSLKSLTFFYSATRTDSFIQPAIHQQTCTELLCASPARGAADAEMNTEARGRETDLRTNPLPDTVTGAAAAGDIRERGRTGSLWITHGRGRRNLRRLPGGGNPCSRRNLPVWAWARHWGLGRQCSLAPSSRDTAPNHAGWTRLYALLVVPSSGILKSQMATFSLCSAS